MPFTFKGCGTKYYGEADRRPDGSYITTEWFVLLYAPLVPLGTSRICRYRPGDVNDLFVQSKGYLIVEKLPLSWAQVFRTYAFVVLCLLWWSLTVWLLFFKFGHWANNHMVLVVFGSVFAAAMPFLWLRWHLDERFKSRYGKNEARL